MQEREVNSKTKRCVQRRGWKWVGRPGSPLAVADVGSRAEEQGRVRRWQSPTGAGVLLLALQLTRPPASPSLLAAALAACRDLLVTLSVRAQLSVPPFQHCCWSLIHSAGPICSAPSLPFHPLILFSPPVFTLSFLHAFSCY